MDRAKQERSDRFMEKLDIYAKILLVAPNKDRYKFWVIGSSKKMFKVNPWLKKRRRLMNSVIRSRFLGLELRVWRPLTNNTIL